MKRTQETENAANALGALECMHQVRAVHPPIRGARVHLRSLAIRPGAAVAATLLNSMKQPRVPNAGSFKPGDPRINRNGRPRTGAALAEAIREQLDPKVALDLLAKFAVDENVPVERRLAVLLPWYQAGYTKPEQRHELALEQRGGPERDWSKVPLEERVELLRRLRAVPELASGDDNEPEAA